MEDTSISWHLRKEVSVANILTMVAIIGAILFAYTDLGQKNALLEQRFQQYEQVQSATRSDINAALADLKFEIRELRAELRKTRP
jgi:hypothetical protein